MRARFARLLGLTGAWLAAVLTLATWTATLGAQLPVRAALARADAQLLDLDARLAGAQAALAPLDALAQPETLATVRALHSLAQGARSAPLLTVLLGERTLADAAALTGAWEDALTERPPVPALASAREEVRAWRERVRAASGRLTRVVWAVNLVALLLGAWSAAGQVALYRAAARRLREAG